MLWKMEEYWRIWQWTGIDRLLLKRGQALLVPNVFSSYKFVQGNNMANIEGSLGTDPHVLRFYMCTAVWQETYYGFKKNFQNLLCSPVSQKMEYNMQANGFIKYYCIFRCIRCGFWTQKWPQDSCTYTAFRTKYSLITSSNDFTLLMYHEIGYFNIIFIWTMYLLRTHINEEEWRTTVQTQLYL
jgi:hypothetical protein